MSSRPARSASIPIPRSSSVSTSARSLEALIPLPEPSVVRPRVAPPQSRSPDDRRTSSFYYSSASHSRPISRSYAHPISVPSASQPRRIQPRVVRPEPTPCTGSPASPTSTRKSSMVGSKPSNSSISLSTTLQGSSIPAPQATFPRPTYLDQSALRDMLHTSSPPPAAKSPIEPTSHDSLSHARRAPSPSDSDDSSVSLPIRDHHITRHVSLSSAHAFKLPTRWSEKTRHSSLTVANNGRDLTFQGTSCNGDRDAASARTNYPIPPACGVYYYEVKILSKGQAGHISIGFAGPDVRISRLPGWEQNSWGYHADDGRSFAAEKLGTPYGPPFGTGDIIGCGIDFSINRAFYTRNGTFLGPVFDNVGKNIDIYPAVGLRHHSESVQANFGHEPFVFNIDYHVRQQRKSTWDRFMAMPITAKCLNIPQPDLDDTKDSKDAITTVPRTPAVPASDEQAKAFLNKLISSYLSHHGYSKTLKAFEKHRQDKVGVESGDGDVEMDAVVKVEEGTIRPDQEIEIRTRLVNSVIAGDIDSAMQDTLVHYPDALSADSGLMMIKLRCRKFVELLLEAAEIQKRIKDVVEKSVEDDLIDGHMDGIDEGGGMDGMDIDGVDPSGFTSSAWGGGSSSSSSHHHHIFVPARGRTQYDLALQQAITYGQELKVACSCDPRPEVQMIYNKTIALIAYTDPLAVEDAGVAEFAGQNARVTLANELNQAILKSLGRPADPALETLYRHTAACVTQLGLLGVGSAVFADMNKEFLEL